MSALLPPELIAAGVFFLDDEKLHRLNALVAAHAKRRLAGLDADRAYAELISEFLLREVGAEELQRQYDRYPGALRDAFLHARRQ